MSESSFNLPSSIQLVSEEDQFIYVKEEHFETPHKLIPSLGALYLYGSREFDYEPDVLGLLVIEDTLVVANAQDLEERGFYDLTLECFGQPQPKVFLECIMRIVSNITIKGDFWFDVDEVDTDLATRFSGSVTDWKMNEDGNSYTFFVPPSIKELSKLRFSFRNRI